MSFRRLAGAPLWSVSTLGWDPWARTPSSHNDSGIGGTLVKPCLQMLKKARFPWEGQNREGQPCRQEQRKGCKSVDKELPHSTLSSSSFGLHCVSSQGWSSFI